MFFSGLGEQDEAKPREEEEEDVRGSAHALSSRTLHGEKLYTPRLHSAVFMCVNRDYFNDAHVIRCCSCCCCSCCLAAAHTIVNSLTRT